MLALVCNIIINAIHIACIIRDRINSCYASKYLPSPPGIMVVTVGLTTFMLSTDAGVKLLPQAIDIVTVAAV